MLRTQTEQPSFEHPGPPPMIDTSDSGSDSSERLHVKIAGPSRRRPPTKPTDNSPQGVIRDQVTIAADMFPERTAR